MMKIKANRNFRQNKGLNNPITERKITDRTNIFIGKVTNSPDFAGRIRVYIPELDKNPEDSEKIPYAFPLLPKTYNQTPKIGEAVFVFIIDDQLKTQEGTGEKSEKIFVNRLYCGPVISNPKYFSDSSFETGQAAINGQGELGASFFVAQETGRHFFDQDLAIISRSQRGKVILNDNADNNADNSSILLHLGHENAVLQSINGRTTTGINAGYFEIKQEYNNELEKIIVHSTIVSDKINLFTYENYHPDGESASSQLFDENNKMLMTINDINDLNKKTYSAVRGEVLIDIINELYHCITEHIHNFPSNPPSNGGNNHVFKPLSEKISDLDNTLINKNIRIN